MSGQFVYRVATLEFSAQGADEDVRKKIEDFLIQQTESQNFQWTLSSTINYTSGDSVKVVCIFQTIRNEQG